VLEHKLVVIYIIFLPFKLLIHNLNIVCTIVSKFINNTNYTGIHKFIQEFKNYGEKSPYVMDYKKIKIKDCEI